MTKFVFYAEKTFYFLSLFYFFIFFRKLLEEIAQFEENEFSAAKSGSSVSDFTFSNPFKKYFSLYLPVVVYMFIHIAFTIIR